MLQCSFVIRTATYIVSVAGGVGCVVAAVISDIIGVARAAIVTFITVDRYCWLSSCN